MNHSFDTEMAQRYGLEESILLNSIEFWVATNAGKPDSQHEGRTWMYNSAEAWTVLHPYWTPKQIRRIMESLNAQGAITTGQFGGANRSTWFTLSREFTDNFPNRPVHLPKRERGHARNGKSLISTDTYAVTDQGKRNDFPLPESISTSEVEDAWADWQQHRREKRNPITPTAANEQIKKLAAIGPERAVAALRHSIAGGWAGIFEPKPEFTTQRRPDRSPRDTRTAEQVSEFNEMMAKVERERVGERRGNE